ncbi:MAG: chemotaxis protein CheD [Candidatus Omnitrophica bacterium]|nr:chemotaxis protein CheD [Candidatus Omnitrophota bacterium]
MAEHDLFVGISDIKMGTAPQVIKTNLGSCIAVCLYAPTKKMGGMLHFMLPYAPPDEIPGIKMRDEKFADLGIEKIIKQLTRMTDLPANIFTAKIFGGAKVLKDVYRNIGEENEDAARMILEAHGIKIVAAKTRGNKGYKIEFDLTDGSIKCNVFGEETEVF